MTKNKPSIEIEPKWSKRINIFILILAAISFGLFNLNSSDIPEGMFEDPKTGKPMLLGKITIEELQQEPFAEWYQMESDGYEVDTELTNAISNPGQYTYEVFLGTWCGDSRREVPRMEKIFSEMGIDMSNVLIVTLDRDNQEIGRIVESPSSETATLESDLFEISLGIPPVPNYSDTE